MRKFQIVTLTVKEQYIVPVYDENPKVTEINGQSIEEVCKDWFINHDINQYHATRDSYKLGGGRHVIDYKIGPVEG